MHTAGLSRRRNCQLSTVYTFITLLALQPAGGASAEDRVQFNRDIRPILADTCFLCHGPDKNSREAGLRLDLREAALKLTESGVTPLVPGKPAESEIVRRIFSDDESEQMPPADFQKKLTTKQKELLRRWVSEGAEYQGHWLYVPLTRPSVPTLTNDPPVANPIDAFVLDTLLAKSIHPSPEADRRTLIRRLSLDLIGLPPTPAEVEAFVTDGSADAYEKQVDRLLKSPHFGERMAVWWLDVARFTDTVGFHGDQNQRIYPYRDYVIDAFNQNKPFDQFTVEQLAGDLLPNPQPEQLVATGFNRLNMMTREGGAQAKEYLAKYGADRVRTVGTTWLGSTLGCCECHDHKFDPFTARDFYSLQAFFADVKQWGVYADYGYTPNPDLKGWSNDHPFPPEIEVESPYLLRRKAQLEQQLAQYLAEASQELLADEKQKSAFEVWNTEIQEFLQHNPHGWTVPKVDVTVMATESPAKKKANPKKKTNAKNKTADKSREKTGSRAETYVDKEGYVRFKSKPKTGDALQINMAPSAQWVAAVRLELAPDAEGDGAVIPKLPRQNVRLAGSVRPSTGKSRPLDFYFADADFKEPRYSGTEEIVGITNGWLTSEQNSTNKHTSVWLLNPPVRLQDGESLTFTVNADASLVPVRIAVSPLSIDPAAAWSSPSSEPTAVNASSFLRSTAGDRDAFAKYASLYQQIAECRGGRAWTMVTVAATPYPIRVLPRGNWLDESGAIVEPNVPHFLPPVESTGDRLTRLDLARWLCAPENPVTARNIVNRLWKQFFGNALSNVVDDLGAQGEPPSHPELLDWLAVEFRESGWDVKHLIKSMVMAHTYRRDSSLRPEIVQLDPNNRWLATQNPRRLDAEFIRDNALAIAGLLNPEIGGPSVKPYQPADYYANLQFPNRTYAADNNDQQWRRGVYMHWQRSFLHPMLANFDAPGREECTANRVVSNTPQQALTLLNDPSFVEAARVFAARLVAAGPQADEAHLDQAFQWALARPARPAERESLLRFLANQRQHFRANPADAEKLLRVGLAGSRTRDPAELAAWTSLARVLLNLQETITRY